MDVTLLLFGISLIFGGQQTLSLLTPMLQPSFPHWFDRQRLQPSSLRFDGGNFKTFVLLTEVFYSYNTALSC